MISCVEPALILNIKRIHTRHPKHGVFRQSCSNIQLSGKDVVEAIKLMPDRTVFAHDLSRLIFFKAEFRELPGKKECLKKKRV